MLKYYNYVSISLFPHPLSSTFVNSKINHTDPHYRTQNRHPDRVAWTAPPPPPHRSFCGNSGGSRSRRRKDQTLGCRPRTPCTRLWSRSYSYARCGSYGNHHILPLRRRRLPFVEAPVAAASVANRSAPGRILLAGQEFHAAVGEIRVPPGKAVVFAALCVPNSAGSLRWAAIFPNGFLVLAHRNFVWSVKLERIEVKEI